MSEMTWIREMVYVKFMVWWISNVLNKEFWREMTEELKKNWKYITSWTQGQKVCKNDSRGDWRQKIKKLVRK